MDYTNVVPGSLCWTDSYYDPGFFSELWTPCHPEGDEKGEVVQTHCLIVMTDWNNAEGTNPCCDTCNSVEKGGVYKLGLTTDKRQELYVFVLCWTCHTMISIHIATHSYEVSVIKWIPDYKITTEFTFIIKNDTFAVNLSFKFIPCQ